MTPAPALVYYNEIDPFAAAWLRSLIHHGHLPDGYVDTRPIQEVQPDDLLGYQQCHFFAGIGGWPHALGRAGWPASRPVWTGSCPCQPFSSAGKQAGFKDDRHLWPAWFRLIKVCRPPVVLGEQVEAAIRGGWWDLVQRDLEGEDYACGMAVLGAHSVGAPHLRQRCWFVAESRSAQREWGADLQRPAGPHPPQWDQEAVNDQRGGAVGDMAQPLRPGRPQGWPLAGGGSPAGDGRSGMAHDDLGPSPGPALGRDGRGEAGLMGNALPEGPQGRLLGRDGPDQRPAGEAGLGSQLGHPAGRGQQVPPQRDSDPVQDPPDGDPSGADLDGSDFWSACDWLPCRDRKSRPVEPGTFPLAHGVPLRVGRLRGYGNAIVPQVAQAFIEAYLQTVGGPSLRAS